MNKTNEEKAMELVMHKIVTCTAKTEEEAKQHVEDQARYFDDIDEMFNYIYLDENYGRPELIDTILELVGIRIEDLKNSKSDTVMEHVVSIHSNVYTTPYGYIFL